MATRPQEITIDALVDMFDKKVHGQLRALWEDGATEAFVVFTNLQLDASRSGEMTAVAAGSTRTYTLEKALEGRLGNAPSNFQYPTHYAAKKGGK